MHYGSRAIGGAALMFTEMTCPSPEARITLGCTGLWNDEQERAWAKHRRFRARELGREVLPPARPCRPQGRDEADVGGHGPAARRGRLGRLLGLADPVLPGQRRCRASWTAPTWTASSAEFVAATERGERAGFDMLELHCAHGYLFASFISPLTNRRSDEYGGSLENRLRFPLEVFTAMREAWPAHKPMSVRISATDWAEGGLTGDEAVAVARAFAEARRRPRRRLDRADGARGAADLRAHVPDAVLGPDPQRGAGRDDVRRQHHDAGPGQHHPRRRARRPRRARRARTSSTRSSP